MRCFFLLVLIVLLFSTPVVAADINLTLHQQSIDDNVTIIVENNSGRGVAVETVYIELDDQRYEHPAKETIPPNNRKGFHFKVQFPALPGSYALIVTVKYINDGKVLSLRHVGLFNFQESAISEKACSIENAGIINEGEIRINAPGAEKWRLVLPEEAEVLSASTLSGQKIFRIRSSISGFNNSYPVFALTEETAEGRHRTGICSGTLTVNSGPPFQVRQDRIPSSFLLISALLFAITAFTMLKKEKPERLFITAFIKYSSRMFFIAAAYFVLENSGAWLEHSLKFIDWKIYVSFVNAALDNLHGVNYRSFFSYSAEVFFIASLLLIFPYFYFFDKNGPAGDDKYVSFLKTLYSLPNILFNKKPYWSSRCKLGMLTIFVKLFFVPLMVSWSINNIFHIKELVVSPPVWDLYTLNSFLVDVVILMDTMIFAVGYLMESRFLKSEIKSVDPTFFGWLVCLWCYPPFNAFSFKPFDHPIINISIDPPHWVQIVMTCAITFLWGIFAWASVALGFKASNLTNRGIVKTGPYRYVRHPAYTVKILIWLIQGIFFAQFGLGILTGFALIYALRAWTEERHLSMDTDFLEYRKMVKWRFIPGLV